MRGYIKLLVATATIRRYISTPVVAQFVSSYFLNGENWDEGYPHQYAGIYLHQY